MENTVVKVEDVSMMFNTVSYTHLDVYKRQGYADILETKYWTYCVIAIGMAVIVGILALIMLLIDKKENSGIYSGELFSALKPRNWKKTFSLADAGVIAFWAFAGISTLQSEWLYEAFWGNEGRYSGFFLITIYVVFYFIVSRYWNVKTWILEAFLASGMILCLIGITDYFQLDVLNFRGNMRPEQSTIFTSTIGNINTYTAYAVSYTHLKFINLIFRLTVNIHFQMVNILHQNMLPIKLFCSRCVIKMCIRDR